jgi:chromosome segregation ATPase
MGNYYYSAQVKAYSKIETIYKNMHKLAKEKLSLIKAAHKNKNLTKKDLDALKAKLKAISKKILGFRKDLSAQYRELRALTSACKKEGAELSALQKIMLAMRKKRQPKYKKPYYEAVRSGVKALGELVKKFEVSWNGLEPAMKELSALQDDILKKREQLLKFAKKSPLTDADKKIIKELKKELSRLLRKEMSLFKKVEDTFLSSENYNKLTSKQKEKFSAMFDSIWAKNDKIHNSKPSFEELFNKLLSSEVKEEDKGKDDNKEASDIFNAFVTSKKVSYSEKMGDMQVTITDYYDKSGKYLGSKIQIGDKVIWKDASGKVLKEYKESDIQTAEPIEDDPGREALGEPINIEPTNTGTIIDRGDYNKPVPEEPQDLMDTL